MTDSLARSSRFERRRAMGALCALFVFVHVALPAAGAFAFHRFGKESLRAGLATHTGDRLILDWLGGLLAWDGGHYLSIASDGYATPTSWAFFPLYPMSARALGSILGGAPRAGLAISLVASAVGCAALYSLVSAGHGEKTAARAVGLFLAFPTHYFFGAFYTESLFFALVTLSLLAYSRGGWGRAAAFGALAAATRSSGILLAPALAIDCLHSDRWRKLDPRLAWLLLVPVGTAVFLVMAYLQTGHLAAPLVAQHAWARKSTFPLLTIAQAAQDLRLAPTDLPRDLDCLATLVAFAIAGRSMRRVDAAQSVYFVLALLMPLSSGLVQSMVRYVAGIPTLYAVVAQDVTSPRRYTLLLAASLAAQVALAIPFCMGGGIF